MSVAAGTVTDAPAAGRFASGLGPAVLVAVALTGLVAAQGGYFPTSWGWSAMASLWVLGIWLVARARTDATRADCAFLTLLSLLIAWVGLSAIWSANLAMTVLEVERGFVVVSGCAAFLALAHRWAVPRLALGILAAITLISTYGLATRLFPVRFGAYEATAVYRLSEPIGYWNGLGIFTVLGILLALGIVAADEVSIVARSVAAVGLVILPVTLFFTFSRGAWISLAFGLAVTVATSTSRLRMFGAATMLAPAPIVGVLSASGSKALTHQHASLAAAVHDGRRLALELVFLATIAVASALLFSAVARRISVDRRTRQAIGASLISLGAVVVAAGLIHVGGPVGAAKRGYDSFIALPSASSADLNSRLLDFSGNGRSDLWGYAWKTYSAHTVLGTGAGTFERAWQKNTKADEKVRDAHGLYIETLAELGPIGLVLLVLALGIPFVAGVRARRRTLVPAILGAYGSFLLHAGVDWDWELAGVTLTGLLIGCLALVSSRNRESRTLGPRVRYTGVGVTVVIAAAAAGGLLGNIPLARSADDTAAGRFDKALTEAVQARRWQPWSPQPWIAQGEAELGLGRRTDAVESFTTALAKDDSEWRAWLDLGLASRGPDRTAALEHAKLLYPRSTEIADAIAALAAAPNH